MSDHARRETLRITSRERQCLQLVANGRTAPEVARELGISQRTVETYLANAKLKLSATTQAEAVAESLRRGWIE